MKLLIKLLIKFKAIVTIICLFALASLAHAGIPVWTIIPLTATTLTVPANSTATVEYLVTNQSLRRHTLQMTPIAGITQAVAPGRCGPVFSLGAQESCILTLVINSDSLAGPVVGGPQICQQNSLQCYQPSVANSLNITKTAAPIPPIPKYSVGGNVTGLAGTVVLQNNNGDNLTIGTDGSFTFPTQLPSGTSYVVTVQTQPASQTCSVSNGTGVIQGGNVSNVIVNCSVNAYTVGGNVAGLTGTVVLQNNGGDNLSVNANGSFTFSTPIAQGSSYAVTILAQPASQTCSVSNGTGVVGAGNVTTVTVTCSTNTRTVGGTLTGLVGTVVLQNNGGDNLSLNADGGFTFSTPVAEGSAYAVTVLTQPALQTCVITNGSGIVGGTNITNVVVTCSNNTTTISVTPQVTIQADVPVASAITITNTGSSFSALNVTVTIPPVLVGFTQDASACTNIAPGASCILELQSTRPYVTQTLTVSGTNTSNAPTFNAAFTLNNFYVFAIESPTVATVIDNTAGPQMTWSTVRGGGNAPSLTDGKTNTLNIVANTGTLGATVAAVCNSSTAGGYTAGTWYLPAICQLGGPGIGVFSAGCGNGLPNVFVNLISKGFNFIGSNYVWSSTEWVNSPNTNAWELRNIAPNDQQAAVDKLDLDIHYCVAPVNY